MRLPVFVKEASLIEVAAMAKSSRSASLALAPTTLYAQHRCPRMSVDGGFRNLNSSVLI
jgi:hypothetical protein